MRDRGVLVAFAALIGGIVAGEHAGPAPARATLVVGIVGVGAAWFVDARARVAIAAVGLALLGAAQTQRALDGQAHSSLVAAVDRRTEVTLPATLADDPESGRFATDALVRVPVAGGHRILLAVATGDDALRLRVLEASDRVVLAGRLGPLHPDRFDGRARRRHAIGRLDGARVLALRPAAGVFRIANGLRALVLRGTTPLPPTRRALLAGFLLGDTRAVPDAVVADYRRSGLSHLLAVSGENVAFTLALFGPLLRRLGLGARTIAAIAIVLLFATMTRFEPSVLRASALAVIALTASFVGRPASGLRALALAVIGLLVLDPFLLHSIAFWLSCGASAGIALFSAPLRDRLPGPMWLRSPLSVSVAAQAGVTPVLLATFGKVPVVTPLANLLAAPAAEAVGVYGMLASAAGGIAPPLAPVLQQPTAVLIAWISTVAHAGAAVGVDLDRRSAWLALAGLASAGVRAPAPKISIGARDYDIRTRALVMGILNRTPDSFYDRGATWDFDAFLGRADELVAAGADLLDVGGVKAGPGPEVGEAEELERVVPAIAALHERFDVPISVDTWRAPVLDAACRAGAVVGNDISGFGDPDYLTVAAAHGATVVATHIRLRPRVADPEPHYDDLVGDVTAFLLERAQRAEAAGLPPDRIVLDAGLDLGKTPAQSAVLLRESAAHAALGYPLLLSASNKRFIGELLGREIDDRRAESLAAVAYGVAWGCRIVRVHDVLGSARVCRTLDALLAAETRQPVTT